jgi:putative acetyltransferase
MPIMQTTAIAALPACRETLVIQAERADQSAVRALLAALDDYLGSLYAPQDNHILGLDALLAPSVRFLVARLDGRVVGCAAVRLMTGEPATGGEPYGEIKRMMVDPSARGQGVGAALLARLEEALRAEGLRIALLETGSQQTEAVRLYQRFGYRPRADFAGYPDNGLSLFLEKRLEP